MIPLIIAGAAASLAGTIGGSIIQGEYAKSAAEAEAKARREAAEQLRAQGKVTDAQYDQMINEINQYYNTRGSLGTRSDVNDYRSAIQNYNPEDYVAEDGGFNFNKTKEDFVNPYYAQIIGQTRDELQHTAAGAGLGRGTGAALNIAKGVAEKSDELYNTAMSDYRDERDFAYKQYTDAITNAQNRLNALREGNQYKLGLQGNLAQNYFDTMDARQSDLMAAKQDKLNAQVGYASAISGLY